uniref:Uncharacterized protein n=1 Tax=Bactrocera latifrons TaxID=174628 RepID=A0A0K8UBQ1_BACLA
MAEEIKDSKGTGDADLPIAIQRNVTIRQLNRKAFLIYPTLQKGRNIDGEIKYIQRKFSAIKIDLKCHKMGLSKSKKRRLRRKRQEHARLNKGTPDMNKVAANPVLVGNAESKNDGIKNELDIKINILARETREENRNVSILYRNNSKQGSDTVAKSPLTLGNVYCVKDNLVVLKDNALDSEINAETNKSNENKGILSNESNHEKNIRLSSRKRKKDEHFSKSTILFPTQNSKPTKENEMSAQSKTEALNFSKINESSADRNLNYELSTLKLVESKFFTKNANIFASISSKSTNHNESTENRKETKHASKSKSETSPKKYKPVKLATKNDIDPKYLFQPIKAAKLSADHNMDTKLASQSKSQIASNNSKSTIYNGLYAQRPQRTKRFTKRRRKISPKNSGVPIGLVLDKLKSREFSIIHSK